MHDQRSREFERVCLVHIGTFKTGTTSIQRFLGLNRDRLAAAGVLLPHSGCDNGPDYVSHHNLVYEITEEPGFDPTYGGIEDLREELRRSDLRVACLSSETISRLWNDPQQLVRLRELIVGAGFTPRIVCYLRPQASYSRSIYAQMVSHHGYRTPLSEFLEATLTDGGWVRDHPNALPLDYPLLLDAFAAVFGREAIVARAYRPATSAELLLQDFALLLVEPALSRTLVMPPAPENVSEDFDTVLEALGERNATAERFRFAPFTIADLVRFAGRFRAPNADLAARYGVALPAVDRPEVMLALPFRRTVARTRGLSTIRRALRRPTVNGTA